MSRRRARPRYEAELAPAVRAYLESSGYRVWVDPDGTDYYDLIARRDRTIGLVELKIADGRKVLAQAIRRRGWADWAAVAVPNEALARRVADRAVAERGRRIGVWWVDGEQLHVVRPALPLVSAGEPDPFRPLKDQMHERLDLVETGHLPLGVAWNLLLAARRDLPGQRSTRDWRIEEFGEDRASPAVPPDSPTEAAGRGTPRTGRPSSRS
ncbi:MAG TPA: hypothetical protein VGX00_07390 [Thermoplasmata archaeon]|nr:hypothetical protein [Thermoplasmata archaeon]